MLHSWYNITEKKNVNDVDHHLVNDLVFSIGTLENQLVDPFKTYPCSALILSFCLDRRGKTNIIWHEMLFNGKKRKCIGAKNR